MDSIKDIILGEFANLSYIDLPQDFDKDLKKGLEITLKDFADTCIDKYSEEFEKDGEISYREQEILDVLKKCQSGEYKDYKIVDYENDNGKSGFVGYAIESSEGEVIIAARGSEMPEGKEDKSKGYEDWIDNVEISTNYETSQQKASKDFVNRVGLKYNKEKNGFEYNLIYLVGHSKGGNDFLYATITADQEVRDRIKNTVTFNAPGFSDKFIKENKYIIDELNRREVFKEYQGSNDIVSSIMNNVSTPIVIGPKELNKSSLERIKGFDDHYIYAMEKDGDNFVLSKDGKTSIPVFVNNLVANLTGTLTDEEIDEIISLANNIINKDEDAGTLDIVKMVVDSGVDLSTAKIIVIQALSEIAITYLKEDPVEFALEVGYILDVYRDIRVFMYSNKSRAKNSLKDGLIKFSKFIVNNKSNIKNTMSKIGIPLLFGGNIRQITTNLNNIQVTSNKCLVSIDDINSALRVYRTELSNVKGSLKKFDLAINKLVQSGWSGHSSYIFYSTRFSMFKASIVSVESQLNHMVRYLEKAKSEFTSRELEEDELVRILA